MAVYMCVCACVCRSRPSYKASEGHRGTLGQTGLSDRVSLCLLSPEASCVWGEEEEEEERVQGVCECSHGRYPMRRCTVEERQKETETTGRWNEFILMRWRQLCVRFMNKLFDLIKSSSRQQVGKMIVFWAKTVQLITYQLTLGTFCKENVTFSGLFLP